MGKDILWKNVERVDPLLSVRPSGLVERPRAGTRPRFDRPPQGRLDLAIGRNSLLAPRKETRREKYGIGIYKGTIIGGFLGW